MDRDGIIVNNTLVEKISCSELDTIPIQNDPRVVDGLKGKLREIQKICQIGIPVQIINGTKNNYIKFAMQCQEVRSTTIRK